MRRALAEQRAGRDEAAHALYAQVLARSPGLPDALHMYGAAQFSIGDHHGALASVAEAVKRFGERVPATILNLGYVVASQLARIAPLEAEAHYLRYLEFRAARARMAFPARRYAGRWRRSAQASRTRPSARVRGRPARWLRGCCHRSRTTRSSPPHRPGCRGSKPGPAA